MQSAHRVHFLNACRNQQNTFSCSIDCFLEIAANIFFPYLKEIPLTNVMQLIFNSCLTYENVWHNDILQREVQHLLYDIRQPIW